MSQGSSRKPGDPEHLLDAGQGLRMTHPFLEEKQESAEAQSRTGRKREEDGGPSGHHCGRSLLSSLEAVNRAPGKRLGLQGPGAG